MTDAARDKYLRENYGITLQRYQEEVERNNGVCPVCESKPITRSLPVDHSHAVEKIKPKIYKIKNGKESWWNTQFSIGNVSCLLTNFKTRQEAAKTAKEVILSKSFRGVLCHRCNRGLQCFKDNVDYLQKAILYLKRYQEKFCLSQ